MLLISAIALIVLWGGVANKIFIILFSVTWIILWKTLRSAMPAIGKKDVSYVAFAAFFCAMSGVLFVVKHKEALCGDKATAVGMLIAAVAGIAMAILFTASFAKLLRGVGKGQLALPAFSKLNVITTHWPLLCYAVYVVGLAVLIVFSFGHDIWIDEAFSVALIKHGYTDMLALAAQDVHPPLYYIILKAIVDGVQFLAPSIPAIFIAKLVSVMAYVLLFVVFTTKARKEWGQYVAILGVVCLVGMHYMLDFGLEVRMYSWGMFFVTLAFIEVKDVLAKGRLLDWTLFVAYSLCAAYTHYFACVAVGFLYLVLWWRVCRTGMKQFLYWAVAAAITIVGYTPWLAVFIAQLHRVSNNFGIGPISLRTFMGCVVCVVDNPLLLIVVMYLLARTVKSVRSVLSDGNGAIALTGILVPVFVIVFGVTVSWLMRPIFLWRYLMPSLCCFWLGVLILVCYKFNKQVRIIATGLIVMVSIADIAGFAHKQHALNKESCRLMSFLQSQPDTAAYVVNSPNQQPACLLSVLSGNDCFNWKENEQRTPYYCHVFEVSILNAARGVSSILSGHQPVYYVVDRKSAEAKSIDAEIERCGLSYTHEGEFQLSYTYDFDRIFIDIYRLTLQTEKTQP